MNTIEFRNQFPWEQSPVLRTKNFGDELTQEETTLFANAYAGFLANKYGLEVRWNFQGQTQGHYVSPKVTT